MTKQELLTMLDTAIVARMSGQAVDEWSEGTHRVKHMTLDKMLAWKSQLENEIEQESGGCAMPVVDVDV